MPSAFGSKRRRGITINPQPQSVIDPAEVINLAAIDPSFYCQTFFPDTFRQQSPGFHDEIWAMLEDQQHRYVAFEVFRDGAKTTILRAYTSKRIAYGISRTVLFISASQEHSIRSLQWLRNQVEFNKPWASLYQLEIGGKWTDSHFEIYHRGLDIRINVVGVGITGQIRGLNINDYRPDLIVVDDPCDDENSATEVQRKKIDDLFFGAAQKSLAPRSECPDAKMVLLQTSLHNEDLINKCHRDSAWATRRFSVFNEDGQSAWPARFPTDELLKEKQSHIDRNILHIWLKEKECKVVSQESSDFRADWLKFWIYVPEQIATFMGIDPVPPPSEREMELGLRTKDFESLSIVGVCGGDIYLLDLSFGRGHDPGWTINEFFRLLDKWRVLRARVEAIGYQRTLKYMLEQEMKQRRRYVQINAASDKRKKRHRIVQALSGPASAGRFFCHNSHQDFITQFTNYPNVSNDDIIDSVAMAVDEASNMVVLPEYEVIDLISQNQKPLSNWRRAP